MANQDFAMDTMEEEPFESECVPLIHDMHGRQRDPFTGNPMEDGQESSNSIFYVPGMPSETAADWRLYVGTDKTISWSEHMKTLRDAGFKGTHITMTDTVRPQDRDRAPSPPPNLEKQTERGFSIAKFWRTKCNYCWAVVRHKQRRAGFRLEELNDAAERGCSTCRVLENSIRHFADIIFPRYSESKVRVLQQPEETYELLCDTKSVRVTFDEYDDEDFILTFDEVTKSEPVQLPSRERKMKFTELFMDREERIMETGSYTAIKQVQSWLNTCSQEHEQCVISTQSPLPRRVLEISNRRAKLIITNGKVAPYVSLSHCWGPKPISRLLSTNMEDMQNDIPWNTLSRTFQDAITVAWKLGFKYIWIDALCILQDSVEDWEYHASKMASVFANSQLTISASRSSDGSGGCFSSRSQDPWTLQSTGKQVHDRTLWLPYVCDGRDRDGCIKTFRAKLRSPHGLYQFRQPKEPLLTRAWVFQEQILSARNIHFASGELYFECKSYIACECSGWTARSLSHHWETRWRKAYAVLQGQHNVTLPAAALRERRGDLPKPKPIPRKAAEFEAYRALIETYTGLDITNEHDRLPALSGITSGRKDIYLAGLWKSILLESLHWYPLPRSRSTRGSIMAYRPANYRAPTWSWASIEAPIRFENTNFHWSNFPTKPIAQILDAFTEPEGVDPRGRVKSGVLKIKGPRADAWVYSIGTKKRPGTQAERLAARYAEIDPSAVDRSLITKRNDRDAEATFAVLRLPGYRNLGNDEEQRKHEAQKPELLNVECYLDVPLCCVRISPAEVVVDEQVTVLLLSSSTALVLKPLRTKHGFFKRVGLLDVKDQILLRQDNEVLSIV